ncbi:MAG: PAS domain-containing sensor histidine kinase [Pseudobdellovibrionaceae bacterium]
MSSSISKLQDISPRNSTIQKQICDALDVEAIISITDATGIITYVNENFCKISGYSEEELIGQYHRIIKSGFHDKEYFSQMWKTITSKKVWKGEVKNKKKDGSYYWVFSTVIPILDENEKIQSYISIRYDITDFKNAQANYMQASKLSSLGEITANIAHELNNPLAVILGIAQVELKKKDLNEKSAQHISKVQKAAERMTKLIGQMKKYSRNSSNDPLQPLHLSEVVEGALVLIENNLTVSQVELKLNLDGGNNKKIFGDAVQLESLIHNLITNSIDAFRNPHCDEEITTRQIIIETINAGNASVLIYEDNAGGIPDSIQKHMFDAFFTTKEVGKGTGLGLSMIKNIVKDHNAELQFSSNLGKGTKFEIHFPYLDPKEKLNT